MRSDSQSCKIMPTSESLPGPEWKGGGRVCGAVQWLQGWGGGGRARVRRYTNGPLVSLPFWGFGLNEARFSKYCGRGGVNLANIRVPLKSDSLVILRLYGAGLRGGWRGWVTNLAGSFCAEHPLLLSHWLWAAAGVNIQFFPLLSGLLSELPLGYQARILAAGWSLLALHSPPLHSRHQTSLCSVSPAGLPVGAWRNQGSEAWSLTSHFREFRKWVFLPYGTRAKRQRNKFAWSL